MESRTRTSLLERRSKIPTDCTELEEMTYNTILYGAPTDAADSDSRPLSPTSNQRANTVDASDIFWIPHKRSDTSFDSVDRRDMDLQAVSSLVRMANSLLLLTGLFTFINIAFIITCYRSIKKGQANELLHEMIKSQFNATSLPSVVPTKVHVHRNEAATIFFLICSILLCATCATLGFICKQWLNDISSKKRRYKLSDEDADEEWLPRVGRRVDLVLEIITTLLMISMLPFFIGLMAFFSPLDIPAVCALLSIFIFCNAFIWLWYTFDGVVRRDSPFQTPVTQLIQLLRSH
ncbi:hypothetical protein FRC02_008573 [Tulasnella sp. 418]|nr:hypothetical protein FRC02_008573 [Tulasnella sp. 418]